MAAIKHIKKKTAKVNKNKKPDDIHAEIHTDEEYRCTCCGCHYKKQEGNFNVSNSPIYKGNNGYLSICKKCLAKLYEQYVEFYDKDEEAAIDRLCQITDMYLDETAWDTSRKGTSVKTRVGRYIARLNLAQSAIGNTYSDTLIRRSEEAEEAEAKEEEEEKSHPSDAEKVPLEQQIRFGLGYSAADYDMMQAEYESWVKKLGPPMDKRQEELYVTICGLKLSLKRGIQNDSTNVGTLANSYKGFIEAATTEIEDRKRKEEAAMRLDPIGEMIKMLEEYCPADFYKDKKLYADFDHLKEYISRFMTRPLRNILTGSKDRDAEYNLPDQE